MYLQELTKKLISLKFALARAIITRVKQFAGAWACARAIANLPSNQTKDGPCTWSANNASGS